MEILKQPLGRGDVTVMQQEYRLYIDPVSRALETDMATTTGRAVMHVGQTLHLATGKFGGEAQDFVVIAFHAGREYDVVVYERVTKP